MHGVARWSVVVGFFMSMVSAVAFADEKPFRIGVVQSKKGQAEQFAPLVPYMQAKGLTIELVGMPSFAESVNKFSKGEIDGMFCASGPAGLLLIMEAGTPVVRPVAVDGSSGGHVVILGKKGSPKFDGKPEFFAGKKVIYPSLATSGEFWFKALVADSKVEVTTLKTPSHTTAIDALTKGAADYAIVKNWVWEGDKSKYADLELLGEDKGENPENALLVTKAADKTAVAKLTAALLGLEADATDVATKVKSSMKISKFIATPVEDFSFTVATLKKAGMTKDFDVSALDKK